MMMFSNATRSSSYDIAVPRNLKINRLRHQFLDCEHLFLISGCAESVLKFVRLIDERLQDVVELLHDFGSFRDVTDHRYIC